MAGIAASAVIGLSRIVLVGSFLAAVRIGSRRLTSSLIVSDCPVMSDSYLMVPAYCVELLAPVSGTLMVKAGMELGKASIAYLTGATWLRRVDRVASIGKEIPKSRSSLRR